MPVHAESCSRLPLQSHPFSLSYKTQHLHPKRPVLLLLSHLSHSGAPGIFGFFIKELVFYANKSNFVSSSFFFQTCGHLRKWVMNIYIYIKVLWTHQICGSVGESSSSADIYHGGWIVTWPMSRKDVYLLHESWWRVIECRLYTLVWCRFCLILGWSNNCLSLLHSRVVVCGFDKRIFWFAIVDTVGSACVMTYSCAWKYFYEHVS